MSWFKRDKSERAVEQVAASDRPTSTCPHVVLMPRWGNVDDIGHEDRATRYRCDGCGMEFSPQEVHDLRRTESQRLPVH